MSTQCLVIADADKIHEYVFSPRKLKLIRGGSEIERQLNQRDLLLALSSLGTGNLRGTNIEEAPTVDSGADWEVVFAGGGTVMCHFADRAKAERYCEGAERQFFERTGVATITTSITDWQGSFKETLVLARAGLELAKAGKQRSLFSGHTPYWKTCESCGKGSAGTGAGGSCGACEARLNASGSESRLFQQVNAELGGRLREADDFEAIAAGEYMAMVYIDGDSMGKYLSEHGGKSKHEYRSKSREVRKAVEGGVEKACVCIGKKLDDGATAPFEALLVGGDDAIVAVRAHHAMDFLMEFEDQWKLKDANYSAGIVWAHHHFPVSQFLEHAEALLRSAKRKRKVNSADFRVITEAMAEAEADREEDLTTAKPYAVADLRTLLGGVRAWKTKGVAANKINELYRIAFEPEHQAKVNYEFLLSRLGTNRVDVEGVVGKALTDPSTGKTRAADAVELWSFV